MHSFWQRLNALFFFALSVLGFLSFLAAGATYWHVATPDVHLKLEKILLCVPAPSLRGSPCPSARRRLPHHPLTAHGGAWQAQDLRRRP